MLYLIKYNLKNKMKATIKISLLFIILCLFSKYSCQNFLSETVKRNMQTSEEYFINYSTPANSSGNLGQSYKSFFLSGANFIMPPNTLDDVVESKEHFFFG